MKNNLGEESINNKIRILLFSNSSWYLYNFWLNNIQHFCSSGYEVVLLAREDGFGVNLKQNGLISSRIDIRDHIEHSLNNLRFSNKMWESNFMKNSGFYTNRIRYFQMLDIFNKTGFNVQSKPVIN